MLDAPPPSATICALTESEQTILRAIRLWLAGTWHQENAWRALSWKLEPKPARKLLRALEAMIRILAASATRSIRYHEPCCPCLGPDESGLLTLVAAAQHEQHDLVRLIAREFAPDEAVAKLAAAAALLAAQMQASGLILPIRFEIAVPSWSDDHEPRLRSTVLH